MEGIYEVIRNVAVYLILVTILLNLVNGNSYKKYVQLTCGMILILIVISPIGGMLSLDDTFWYNFNLSSFKVEMMEEEYFSKAEEVKDEMMEEEYKKTLLDKISAIVEQQGRYVKNAEIVLLEADYGVIEEIVVEISNKDEENLNGGMTEAAAEVEKVEIEEIVVSDEENSMTKEKEEYEEKNKTTEAVRKELASAFAMKEEQIAVYEKGE